MIRASLVATTNDVIQVIVPPYSKSSMPTTAQDSPLPSTCSTRPGNYSFQMAVGFSTIEPKLSFVRCKNPSICIVLVQNCNPKQLSCFWWQLFFYRSAAKTVDFSPCFYYNKVGRIASMEKRANRHDKYHNKTGAPLSPN